MKRIIAVASLILIIAQCALAEAKPEPYQTINIEPIFSKLTSRDNADRVHSGQIRSGAGLIQFEKTYGINIDSSEINFGKQALIFGITDQISTRAFQFLKQEKTNRYTLDYAATAIRYKLRRLADGRKHSYIQVFVLNNTENIPRIWVKNYMGNGLSKNYD